MRVWVGGVETIYPARFFFADTHAQWFPNPHGAEATPWLKQFERNDDWGDDGTLKKLDRGINPGYPGICSVGDPQWFIDGRLPESILTAIAPSTPACIGHTPPPNPDVRCPPFRSLIPCSGCADGSVYSAYRVTFTGGTGGFAYLNGVHWFLFRFTIPLLIEYTAVELGGDNQLQFWFAIEGCVVSVINQGVPGTGAFYQQAPPVDCLDIPFALPLVFNTSPDVAPSVIID